MPANQGSTANQNGNKEFLEFLRSAPSLEDASAGATTELTGLVSRTTDGRFAITTGDGQTFEMEVGAVQRFRPVEGGGFSPIATILVSSEALKNATLRPLKPIIKEIAKDPIKDIIHDGTHTYFSKDIATDPIADKHLPKDIRTDPIQDKHPFKDIRKDPLQDPIDTGWADVAGTGRRSDRHARSGRSRDEPRLRPVCRDGGRGRHALRDGDAASCTRPSRRTAGGRAAGGVRRRATAQADRL
jgi:hypothetical protein